MTNIYAKDQFGNKGGPLDSKAIRRSLLEATYRKTARPTFVDLKNGGSKQVGYVIPPLRGENESELWCDVFTETVEAFDFGSL